jgi:DNA polymerase
LARRLALQTLESLERAGVTHLPKARGVFQFAAPASAAATEPPSRPPLEPAASALSPASSRAAPPGRDQLPAAALPPQTVLESQSMKSTAAKAKPPAELLVAGDDLPPPLPAAKRLPALEVIQREVSQCVRCRDLAETRTQTVFGVGDPNARLCFLGEAPGADEDRQGEPFVGRAGQLLTKIIEACTMRREDVYILNTLKCRPPGNRNPLPDELAHCRGFLDRQLEIIQPEFICCLGAVAARALLATEAPIGKLRKRFFDYRGSRVICTYHPAYLLRNPAAKKDVWEDMKLLLEAMGIELPGKHKG